MAFFGLPALRVAQTLCEARGALPASPKRGMCRPHTLSITCSPYSDYKLESRVGGNLPATGTLDVSLYSRHFSPCAPKSPWGHVSVSRGTA